MNSTPATRRRRKGLTAEEHRTLGAELVQIRDRLQQIATNLYGAYGCKPAPRLADKITQRLDTLRCKLDDLACQDLPAAYSGQWYYPQPPMTR